MNIINKKNLLFMLVSFVLSLSSVSANSVKINQNYSFVEDNGHKRIVIIKTAKREKTFKNEEVFLKTAKRYKISEIDEKKKKLIKKIKNLMNLIVVI